MYENQNPFLTARSFYFGVGMRKIVGEKLKAAGCKKVMILFDKGIEQVGIPKKVIDYITAEGIEVVTYNGVLADPPSHIVDEAAAVGKAAGVDGIVAVGGGSTIDTSKATRVLLSNDGPLKVNRFIFDGDSQVKPSMPLVIIPTTAGTGSEATEGAMISHIDEKGEHWKKILECVSNQEKDFAVVDPELALGTPKGVSIACAFDVLAHAMESAMSTLTGPIFQTISETAIGLFAKSCKKIYENVNDIEARTDMAMGCLLAGISINQAYVNAGHAMGHALGSVFGVPHGKACGVFIPAIIEFYAESLPEEIAKIGAIFGVVRNTSENNVAYARRFAEYLHKFSKEVGLDLKDIVATKEECYKITEQALADYSWHLGLRGLDEVGVKWLIDRTYEY